MKIALWIAAIICAVEIVVDVYNISEGESTNLALHVFYEVLFILSINLLC